MVDQPFAIDFGGWFEFDKSRWPSDPSRADLKIAIGDYCVTDVEDILAQSTRDHVRVSALAIAAWLAANWWRLRYEPASDSPSNERASWRLAHELKGIGHGYIWPALRISGDDNVVHCSMMMEDPLRKPVGTVRYLRSFPDQIVSANQYEASIDAFLSLVLNRFETVGPTEQSKVLRALWQETCEERQDQKTKTFRAFEAQLGYDPGEAPDEVVEQVVSATTRIGAAAAGEIASSSKAEVRQVLRNVNDALAASEIECAMAPIQDLSRQSATNIDSLQPWRIGWDYAHLAREYWGLSDGPIPNKKLSELFGINEASLSAPGPAHPHVRLGVGEITNEKLRMALSSQSPQSKRFEFSRILSDALLSSYHDSWRPATNMRTRRQQIQRGFAAEFLCPVESLSSVLRQKDFTSGPTESDIEEAARTFSVDNAVVRHQIENHFAAT